MSKRILFSILLCSIVLLLTACGQTAAPPSTEVEAPTKVEVIEPTVASMGAYQPIDEAECTALQEDLAVVLGVEVNQGTAPFENYATGEAGTCCLLRAAGTGENFPNELGLITTLQFFFEDRGWIIDIRYTAEAPNGIAFGLIKGTSLVLVSVVWTPSADANCPKDQPISACNLEPGQMLYIIRARLAKK